MVLFKSLSSWRSTRTSGSGERGSLLSLLLLRGIMRMRSRTLISRIGSWMYVPPFPNTLTKILTSSQRGRVYILSPESAGTFLADHKGRKYVPAYGCPVFSLGEPYYAESMLPKGYKTIIDWFQEVGLNPEYTNPAFERFDFDEDDEEEENPLEGGVELKRAEEIKDDEETKTANYNLKAREETTVEGPKGVENTKPGKETS